MISSLRGAVVAKDTQGATIECGGVGYGVAMSLGALGRLPALGQEAMVWVHTALSQDALRLYGFADVAERAAFLVLLATPGVGPRLALAILSALSPQELATAVSLGDKAQLRAIPGVGAKKAERLLVELRDRLPEASAAALLGQAPGLRADLHSALLNLGFTPQVAERAARQALDDAPAQRDLTTLVRAALRSTTMRH